MNRLSDNDLIREICTRLDASCANLPVELEQRLDAMRQRALIQQGTAELQPDPSFRLESGHELSPAIESRLNAARRRAIAHYQTQQSESHSGEFAQWLDALINPLRFARSASILATACVLVTVVSLFYVASRPESLLPIDEEMGLIASAGDFELYENLEFYLWLAETGLPN